MYCYKLIISYDGTDYSGWQVQPNALTIQEVLHKALRVLLRSEEVFLIGSGRTDAGVHAAGQVAHFKYEKELDLNRLLVSLNGMIPHDIRIRKIENVAPTFHSQYSAIGKEYHYHLYLDRIMDPFRRKYSWHVPRRLNLDLLKEAAICFVGTHDFTSFANEAHAGSAARNPVRTLYRLDSMPFEGGIRLEFHGNGFLYKMVRNIVGTIVDVAASKKTVEDVKEIFLAKDRRKASKAAPPQGLFLFRVDYPKENLSH